MNKRGERLFRETANLRHLKAFKVHQGLPGGSDSTESACNARDLGSIPGSGRSPGEGNCYPLKYSGLENPMDRGAWQATVHGLAVSDTTEQLTISLSRATKFNSTPFVLCLRQFGIKEIKILFSQQSHSWACILRKH